MTTPALALAGATRRNGFILEVALTMAVGETIAILGPNGAGKTTLLRLSPDWNAWSRAACG